MILRMISIVGWHIEFYFAEQEYDQELILGRLYDFGSPAKTLYYVNDMMESNRRNAGYTFTNREEKLAVVLIGPTDKDSFIDVLLVQLNSLFQAIAGNENNEAKLSKCRISDSAKELVYTICRLAGV